jgi:hypothetical protein
VNSIWFLPGVRMVDNCFRCGQGTTPITRGLRTPEQGWQGSKGAGFLGSPSPALNAR